MGRIFHWKSASALEHIFNKLGSSFPNSFKHSTEDGILDGSEADPPEPGHFLDNLERTLSKNSCDAMTKWACLFLLHPPHLLIFSQNSAYKESLWPLLGNILSTLLEFALLQGSLAWHWDEKSFLSMRLEARSDLSINEGYTTCPLISHSFGWGISSLQVAPWFTGANSPPSTSFLFCKSHGSLQSQESSDWQQYMGMAMTSTVSI